MAQYQIHTVFNPASQVTDGLTNVGYGSGGEITISGLSLVTFGFLWSCADIWAPVSDEVTTTWTSLADGDSDNC